MDGATKVKPSYIVDAQLVPALIYVFWISTHMGRFLMRLSSLTPCTCAHECESASRNYALIDAVSLIALLLPSPVGRALRHTEFRSKNADSEITRTLPCLGAVERCATIVVHSRESWISLPF